MDPDSARYILWHLLPNTILDWDIETMDLVDITHYIQTQVSSSHWILLFLLLATGLKPFGMTFFVY